MVNIQELLVIKVIILIFIIIISLLEERCLFGGHQVIAFSSSSGTGQAQATWTENTI